MSLAVDSAHLVRPSHATAARSHLTADAPPLADHRRPQQGFRVRLLLCQTRARAVSDPLSMSLPNGESRQDG